MNYFKLFYTFWSFRNELYYVSLAFLLVLLMPVFAVFMLTHAGIDIISDRLTSVNEENKTVEIHDPTTGEVVDSIDLTMAWPATGVYTLEFGQSSGFQVFHTGIDIASANGKVGDPINPLLPGKVIYAGEIWWGYGKHIIIDHGDNITTVYAHLDKIFVYKDQEVKTNKHVIGNMGSTGWSTGPHLHFEVRVYGIPVDPRTFLGSGAPTSSQ
ncbi:peptidoglycan DD-metalloendopeptidase family protein [Candidatus Daviesbacteria bacterium]|nr:peptidoglycan DD-metalloendopeptidase family protein [Candidatus Daviesbacteria bacterium]